MKKYNTLYYLLFVLLIMGAFASMAQNAYGFIILGAVAFVFSGIFLYQMIERLFATNFKDGLVEDSIELGALVLLSAILGLRVFYIHFESVEIIFGLAGVVLVLLYGKKLVKYFSDFSSNRLLKWLVPVFYSSIIFYILSMIAAAFFPSLSEPVGELAFGLTLIVVLAAVVKREQYVEGEKRSVLYFLLRLRDKSVLLGALFLVFTAYMGLTKIGALPKMYSNEFPQAYFQLVAEAEGDIEQPVDGKYRYEKFKEQYQIFLEHNSNRSPIE
jgi:hypothetical protein